MRDDAKYVVHPNGSEVGYIPFIVHEKLAWQDQRTIRRLAWAWAITSAALITALVVLIVR